MKTDLLKEAIAEADMIKKLAVENAKASLNEAFDSKIKSMLAARLAEEAEDLEEKYEEEEDEDKVQGEYQEAKDPKEKDDEEQQYDEAAGEDPDEAFDIDAILAEMEGDKDGDPEEEEPVKEAKRNASKEKSEGEPEEGEPEEGEPEEGGEDNMEEDLDLDALIAEMMGKGEEEPEMEEMYSKKEEEMDEAEMSHSDDDLLKRLEKLVSAHKKKVQPKVEEPKQESIELQEIKRQAAELAQKVNETNLINAKLLYLNKVLRNHTLSEQQKLKVVAAFDKASSVKEAKIVYESINEALNIKVQNTKQSLKESLGFASKASGTSTKREIISEADSHVARWQKLAGIRK